MAIVYKHIRKDTNEVFYIGIGSRKDRATSKNKRNPHWHNIVKKVGYDIEIVAEGISIEEAKEIEISLIAELGRADLGTGSLVNMTAGGDGQWGNHSNKSEEHKNRIKNSVKEWHKNNSHSIESKQKMSEGAKKQRSSGAPTHTTPHSQESKLKMSQARKEYWEKKKAGLL